MNSVRTAQKHCVSIAENVSTVLRRMDFAKRAANVQIVPQIHVFADKAVKNVAPYVRAVMNIVQNVLMTSV